MDRFVQAWKAGASAAAPLPQDEDDDEDMRDFVVDDEDEELEYAKAEAAFDDELDRHAAKRIKLQAKTGTSATSSKKKKKTTLTAPTRPQSSSASATTASVPAAAASSTSSSSVKKQRRIDEKLTAKQAFKQQQQQERRQRDQPASVASLLVAPVAAAAASPSPPPAAAAASSSADPPAAVAAVAGTRIARTPSTVVPSQAASKPAASKPAPAAAASASAAAAALPRKRKFVVIDDDEEEKESELQRLVASIEDFEDDTPHLARSLSSAEAIEAEAAAAAAAAGPRKQRNVLGMLEAVRSNSLPFAGTQLARLQRLQHQRIIEEAEAASSGASDSRMNGESIASTRALLAPNGETCFPFYATSGFRAPQVLHQGLLHHSLRLLWSGLRPVQDWSLCGSFGSGVDLNARPAGGGISYVNSLEFDAGGQLLAASSNNARLSVYDFDCVWLDGRNVEKAKRSRILRRREEAARLEELTRARPNSPPRQGKWKLNQAPPSSTLRPLPTLQKRPHEFLAPIFSMDLHPEARGAMAPVPTNPQATLKQIDSQRWNPYNPNEIAVSSQRNNQVFIFDLTRCDEYGAPHRRALACDPVNSSTFASGVMDFRWFPSSGAHASTHTLVAALRSGEINILDLRVPNGQASTAMDAVGGYTSSKLFRSQQQVSSSLTTRLAHSQTANPPVSVQLTQCGTKLYVFTEMGSLECWDTRSMRATYDHVLLLDSLWGNSYAAAAGASGSASAAAAASGLGFEFRQPSSRVCSSSIHPQDDLCFLFQLLNGCVGMLDLNPASASYKACTSVVPFDADFVSAGEEYSMRARRNHCFMSNGQGGSMASAKREKTMAVCNTRNDIEIWESCLASSCASSKPASPPARPPLDPMLARELARSSAMSASSTSSSLHLLRSFPLQERPSITDDDYFSSAALPVMSMTVHPRVPYLLFGSKQQQVRIATHHSEIDQTEQEEEAHVVE